MTIEPGAVTLPDMITLATILITAGGLFWQVKANAKAVEDLKVELKADHERLGAALGETSKELHGRVDILFGKHSELAVAQAGTNSTVVQHGERLTEMRGHLDLQGEVQARMAGARRDAAAG